MAKNSRQRSVASSQFVCQPTKNGFIWGPVEIERLQIEDESGSVILGFKTEDIYLEILVTRAGMVRLFPTGGMFMVEVPK